MFFIGVKYAQVSVLGRREDLCRMASITSRPVRDPKMKDELLDVKPKKDGGGRKTDGAQKVIAKQRFIRTPAQANKKGVRQPNYNKAVVISP